MHDPWPDGEASVVCWREVRFVRRETGGRRTSHLCLAGCTPLVPLVGGPCSSAARLRRPSANVGRVCVACAKCDLQVLSLGECRGCMCESRRVPWLYVRSAIVHAQKRDLQVLCEC